MSWGLNGKKGMPERRVHVNPTLFQKRRGTKRERRQVRGAGKNGHWKIT